jgi:hypothetical protein
MPRLYQAIVAGSSTRRYANMRASPVCEQVDAPIIAAHPLTLRILERALAQIRKTCISAHGIGRGILHVWKRVQEPVLSFVARQGYDGKRGLRC